MWRRLRWTVKNFEGPWVRGAPRRGPTHGSSFLLDRGGVARWRLHGVARRTECCLTWNCLAKSMFLNLNNFFPLVLPTIGHYRWNPQSKLYIPSTLNMDLILWHTQLIVCAENVQSWFKSWISPFTFPAYILPDTLNCMCVSLFKFHIWILE